MHQITFQLLLFRSIQTLQNLNTRNNPNLTVWCPAFLTKLLYQYNQMSVHRRPKAQCPYKTIKKNKKEHNQAKTQFVMYTLHQNVPSKDAPKINLKTLSALTRKKKA